MLAWKKLVAYALHGWGSFSISCAVALWLEVCVLHRAGRVLKHIDRHHGLDGCMYALSRARRMRKMDRAFRDVYLQRLCASVEWMDTAGLHNEGRWQFCATLKRIYATSWGAERSSSETEAFDRWYAFFFDETQAPEDVQADAPPRHRCSEAGCGCSCRSLRDVKRLVRKRVHEAFFSRRCIAYNPGRWTKQMPYHPEFTALMTLSRSAFYAAVSRAQTQTKEKKKGARLGRVAAKVGNIRLTPWLSMVGLCHGQLLDSFIHQIFNHHSYYIQSKRNKRHQKRTNTFEKLAATIRLCQVLKIIDICSHIWHAVNENWGNCNEDDTDEDKFAVMLWEVLQSLWPNGVTSVTKELALTGGFARMYSDLVHTFTNEYDQPPWSYVWIGNAEIEQSKEG